MFSLWRIFDRILITSVRILCCFIINICSRFGPHIFHFCPNFHQFLFHFHQFIQLLFFRGDQAETICVCKDGFSGDPDSKTGCVADQVLPKNDNGCLVNNQTYLVGQKWNDGCDYTCTCSEKLEILCQVINLLTCVKKFLMVLWTLLFLIMYLTFSDGLLSFISIESTSRRPMEQSQYFFEFLNSRRIHLLLLLKLNNFYLS